MNSGPAVSAAEASGTPVIRVRDLSFGYVKNAPVLNGVSLDIRAGERWAIIGKNGCGKSTLLKCIGNLLQPGAGTVHIGDRPLSAWRPIDLAQRIAYVPQASGSVLPPYSVADFVMLGRFPYQGLFALSGAHDRAIVGDALALTDTAGLAHRSVTTLSGGELQRVFLAAAVAQRTDILLLDEPMSFLDPLHQAIMRRSLDRIHKEFNAAIVTVTHDVNDALKEHSHVCALVRGSAFFKAGVEEFRGNASALLHGTYSIAFREISSGSDRYFVPEGRV